MEKQPEAWMRDIHTPGLEPLLQPIANTWIAVTEEMEKALIDFPESHLWKQPANCASVGFHIQHIGGVIDRLLTYAEGKTLADWQFENLKAEENPRANKTCQQLLEVLKKQVDSGVNRLCAFRQEEFTDARKVGRAGLPSSVIGLLFHAAEHSMRHTGQLIVTARVLMALEQTAP